MLCHKELKERMGPAVNLETWGGNIMISLLFEISLLNELTSFYK